MLITSLLSGTIGAVFTLIWNKYETKKMEKIQILKILMSNRYNIAKWENVEVLNMIDIVFYSCDDVRNAWKYFLKKTNTPNITDGEIKVAYSKLLLEITKNIGTQI